MKFARSILALTLANLALIGVMFALAVASCSKCHASDKYAEAFAQWQTSDKPLVLWYGAEWCGPCKTAHQQYEAAIASGAIVVKLDVDRDRAVCGGGCDACDARGDRASIGCDDARA